MASPGERFGGGAADTFVGLPKGNLQDQGAARIALIGSARLSDVAKATAWGVRFVSGREVARDGIGPALALIPEGAEVVICLGCDALDPAIMPEVIGRTAVGLSNEQVLGLVEGVAARARIAGFDMVEFMPGRDFERQGGMVRRNCWPGFWA